MKLIHLFRLFVDNHTLNFPLLRLNKQILGALFDTEFEISRSPMNSNLGTVHIDNCNFHRFNR